jgi:phosphotransferase system enzyme I (PtsP)
MISSQTAGEETYANPLGDSEKMSREDGERLAQEGSNAHRVEAAQRVKKDLLKGIPVSAGFGKGHVHYLRDTVGFSDVYFHEADDVEHELSRFENALKRSETHILQILGDVTSELSPEEESILRTYLMYLRDGGLKDRVIHLIRRKYAAEYALKEVVLNYLRTFSRMEDSYLRGRGFDVENVGKRILRNLLGLDDEEPRNFSKNTIIIASSLSPSDLFSFKQESLTGIILSKGAETSHVAIIARSQGIPMVIIARGALWDIQEDDFLIIDGTSGIIFHNPSEMIVREYERLEDEKARNDERLESLKDLKTQTLDGFEVRLGANIGLLSDLEFVEKYGADHIGLYRTEFPFLVRERFPSEREQRDLYGRIIEGAGGREVTIRTLDIGGDKFPSYLGYPREDNPYLGWRSIRISLEMRDIFREQLRAILRTSAFGSLRILFPMITSIAEVKAALTILNEEKGKLTQQNIPFDETIKVGILVEVPAAVIILEKFLPYVDFISIGTNDLVQYILAVDRNNQKVASIYNPLHPAVISTIHEAILTCKRQGKPAVICGEAAANLLCVYLYLGMGVDQMSMNPSIVPKVKHLIRNVRQTDTREVLRQVLAMENADEIGAFLNDIVSQRLHNSKSL